MNTFSLRNLVQNNPGNATQQIVEKQSHTISYSTTDKSATVNLKNPKGQPRKFKVVNIGDAINKKDLIRIRSGSPGLRAGKKPEDLGNG